MNNEDIIVPLDVPKGAREGFRENYLELTGDRGRLVLFAGDQKVEHLNDDFSGEGISPEDADPKHLFDIADRSKIGAFATQFGLIARYGMDHPKIPYVVKLNSKTDLVKSLQAEPLSKQWVTVDQVAALKNENDLKVLGIGYTVYLGSENEAIMLQEAAQIVHRAHHHGLPTILSTLDVSEGKGGTQRRGPHLIAGAAGVAACLGSDFAKVDYPEGQNASERFKEAVRAAGRTKVICSGGGRMEVRDFLDRLHDQI